MHQRRRAVYPPPANPVHPTPLSLSPPDPPRPLPISPPPAPSPPSRCKSVYTSRIPRRCAFPYGNMSDCAYTIHYVRAHAGTPRTFKTGGIATNYNGYGMAVGEEKRLISREPAARGGGEWGGRWGETREMDEGPREKGGGVGGKGAGKIHRRMGGRDTDRVIAAWIIARST